jgi:hypothetical protein
MAWFKTTTCPKCVWYASSRQQFWNCAVLLSLSLSLSPYVTHRCDLFPINKMIFLRSRDNTADLWLRLDFISSNDITNIDCSYEHDHLPELWGLFQLTFFLPRFSWISVNKVNPLAHSNTGHICFISARNLHVYHLILWLVFKRTQPYPVTLLSNWLKLFLSQTLSHIDTYTILKFSHYSPSCLW